MMFICSEYMSPDILWHHLVWVIDHVLWIQVLCTEWFIAFLFNKYPIEWDCTLISTCMVLSSEEVCRGCTSMFSCPCIPVLPDSLVIISPFHTSWTILASVLIAAKLVILGPILRILYDNSGLTYWNFEYCYCRPESHTVPRFSQLKLELVRNIPF
jgi:hypothetical protein